MDTPILQSLSDNELNFKLFFNFSIFSPCLLFFSYSFDFLFEFNNIKFASFAKPIKIFEQIYNACSIYEDINYGFDNNYLYLSTPKAV